MQRRKEESPTGFPAALLSGNALLASGIFAFELLRTAQGIGLEVLNLSILLTGGAGYIGSHTAVALISAGIDVVIADNLCNSNSSILRRIEKITGKSPAFYRMDVNNSEELERLFSEREINGVIHFAGYKAVNESVKAPLPYYRNNLDTTFTLLEAMRRHQCGCFVFSSSASVYGESNASPLTEDMPVGNCKSPYAYSKLMNERILQDVAYADSAMSVVLLRYFNPVGAHSSGLIGEQPAESPTNLMPRVVAAVSGTREALHVYGNDYPTPDGTCIRDYIHIMDLAEGHVSALQYAMKHRGAEIFNLGTGRGTSVLELLETFARENRVKVPYVISERREGDIPVCYASPNKAFRVLGWKATRNLADMCRDAWKWEKTGRNWGES